MGMQSSIIAGLVALALLQTSPLNAQVAYPITYNAESSCIDNITEDINLENIDCEIESSKQGAIGDCWLLAGLNSLTTNEGGKKVIANAIQYTNNGTYTVKLNGIGESYTITDDEVYSASQDPHYSSGDDTMRLFELAINKCRTGGDNNTSQLSSQYRNRIKRKEMVLRGGYGDEVYSLLGLYSTNYSSSDANYEKNVNQMIGKMIKHPDKYNAVITTRSLNYFVYTRRASRKLQTITGDEYNIPPSHALSIKKVDGNNVTLVDPHDSSIEYTVRTANLLKLTDTFTVTSRLNIGTLAGRSFVNRYS